MKKIFKSLFFIAAAVFLLGLILLGYIYFIEPNRLIIKTIRLTVPHWSKELDNLKIVAVSDIHGGGHFITAEKIQTIAQTINEQEPDVVFLLGDFVSQIHDDGTSVQKRALKMPIKTIAENLSSIQAKYGVLR